VRFDLKVLKLEYPCQIYYINKKGKRSNWVLTYFEKKKPIDSFLKWDIDIGLTLVITMVPE
jgi:hypothetical protein